MIPKIIWQTHEWEYKDLPHNFIRCTQTWKNLNPEWEYRYHSAIDRAIAVRDFDLELYQYYMFADKVTQSDIWRYVVLYQHGGLYSDMDSFCVEPIDFSIKKMYKNNEMLCSELLINKQDNIIEQVNNSHFAAIPNSYIIKDILEKIKNKYREIPIMTIYNLIEEKSNTGPRGISEDLWLGTEYFSCCVIPNKDNVSFGYSGAIHSQCLKINFKSDYTVNYFGDEITYSQLCKNMNWDDPQI
jgi:hypothetical protein